MRRTNRNASNRDRENNFRAGLRDLNQRPGGGKVTRRRHSSHDTQNQRKQYNYRHQQSHPPARSKKTIVTPEQPVAESQQSARQSSSDNATVTALPKLDPADPTHSRRIQQRRRQILFGKNTAGYEEYTKKVPRHKRRPRSLECPATPDHTLDISTKRWQGLMNAWRRALHAFDPPDLHLRQPSQDTITLAPRPCVTPGDVAQEEIAQAKASGLQVAFGSMNVGKEAGLFSVAVAGVEEDTSALARGRDGGGLAGETSLSGVAFEEEAVYLQAAAMEGRMSDREEQPMDGRFLEESDSDSDDDVL